MDEILFHRHYIVLDALGRVTEGFSDAFRAPCGGEVCIQEQGGYQFCLLGVENPPLFDGRGVPLYRWCSGAVERRTQEELQADAAALPEPEPTQLDQIEAQVTYTAMMTDTLLEV